MRDRDTRGSPAQPSGERHRLHASRQHAIADIPWRQVGWLRKSDRREEEEKAQHQKRLLGLDCAVLECSLFPHEQSLLEGLLITKEKKQKTKTKTGSVKILSRNRLTNQKQLCS